MGRNCYLTTFKVVILTELGDLWIFELIGFFLCMIEGEKTRKGEKVGCYCGPQFEQEVQHGRSGDDD